MPAPEPSSQPNRAARRATRSGAAPERRYADPRRVTIPQPRQWAMRRH
ncbi:MAG: hypothetical protein AVDCRST_MAG07-936 [uncultured Frankineae bacterium]|uniref:Uncharacterized protein n=1 Tax=uncultured Frankineae bacterium TaxID=437475 RepID=A0A6J4KWE2_9ACTN|nr:MAG: hypothetical protein AVDCRST_MAG07-936 [uncultured Frankineae bacterium]